MHAPLFALAVTPTQVCRAHTAGAAHLRLRRSGGRSERTDPKRIRLSISRSRRRCTTFEPAILGFEPAIFGFKPAAFWFERAVFGFKPAVFGRWNGRPYPRGARLYRRIDSEDGAGLSGKSPNG